MLDSTTANPLLRPNIICGCATARCNNWTLAEMDRTAVNGATFYLPGVNVVIFILVVNPILYTDKFEL